MVVLLITTTCIGGLVREELHVVSKISLNKEWMIIKILRYMTVSHVFASNMSNFKFTSTIYMYQH